MWLNEVTVAAEEGLLLWNFYFLLGSSVVWLTGGSRSLSWIRFVPKLLPPGQKAVNAQDLSTALKSFSESRPLSVWVLQFNFHQKENLLLHSELLWESQKIIAKACLIGIAIATDLAAVSEALIAAYKEVHAMSCPSEVRYFHPFLESCGDTLSRKSDTLCPLSY